MEKLQKAISQQGIAFEEVSVPENGKEIVGADSKTDSDFLKGDMKSFLASKSEEPVGIFNGIWTFISHEISTMEINEVDSRYLAQRERVSNFLKVPLEIEKLMIYGYAICLDSFLAVFTSFPIRIFLALLNLRR